MTKIANALNLPASTSSSSLTLGNGSTILTANILECNGSAAFGSYAGTAAPSNGLLVSGYAGFGISSPTASLHISRALGATSGSAPYLTVSPVLDATLDASTESPDVLFDGAASNRQWSTGAITNQRFVKVTPGTISFVGASTVTDAAALGVTGAAAAGTNATITNSHAVLIQSSSAGSGTTNSYGLTVRTQSGATNNYCSQFLGGNVGVGISAPASTLHVSRDLGATSGVVNYFRISTVADVGLTASTEVPLVYFDFAANATQWATGSLTTERFFRLTQPTIAFAAASTATTVATVGIDGGPVKGTNATVTNSHAMLISAGAVGAATNSYGLSVNAQTGATNNYCAQLLGGNIGIGTSAPTATVHLTRSSAATSGTAPYLYIQTTADTGLGSTKEVPVIQTDYGNGALTWAAGTIALQRFVVLSQPTIAFASASTVTSTANLAVVGAPAQGTNATLTNTHGILVTGVTVSGGTNSYGLSVNAMSGATNNYCAQFLGGRVGIGTSSPDASALLAMSSTTQGFLPPAMTSTQKNAISSPATGLVVYDTTLPDMQVYDGSAWVSPGRVFLQKIVADGTGSSVTFSSFTAGLTHLEIVVLVRGAQAGTTADNLRMRFNGDTGTNYYTQYVQGVNATASAAQSNINGIYCAQVPGTGSTAQSACLSYIRIPFYTDTTFLKNAISNYGQASATGTLMSNNMVGGWNSSSAITSITLFTQAGGNIGSGSLFYLYGYT